MYDLGEIRTDEQLRPLVQAAMQKDAEAFEALCNIKGRDILYLCLKLCGNEQDAYDAAQEALLRMHQSIHRLRDADAFRPWMSRIVSFACADVHRRQNRGKEHIKSLPIEEYAAQLPEESADFLPAEVLERSEDRRLVLECMDGLSYKYKQVLLLFYFEELTYKQIAIALKTSPQAVQSSLQRARKALRNSIEKRSGAALQGAIPATGVPVLTVLMRAEAARAAAGKTVGEILAACGFGAAATGIAGGVKLALVGISLFAVTACVGVLFMDSAASSTTPEIPAPIPQSAAVIADAPSAGGAAEPFSVPSAGNSSTAAVHRPSSVPVEGDDETPSTGIVPPATNASITVQGSVYFSDTAGVQVPAGQGYAAGCSVILWYGSTRVADATTDAVGEYYMTIQSPRYGGQYTLEVAAREGDSLQGTVAGFVLQRGAQSLPQVAVTDADAPHLALRIEDAAGQPVHSLVNPHIIIAEAQDRTHTALSWGLYHSGGNEPLYEGVAGSAIIADLSLARGRYTIVFTAQDLAGNTTTVMRNIIIL